MKAQKAAGKTVIGILAGLMLVPMFGEAAVSGAEDQNDLTAISADTVIVDEDGSFTASVRLDTLPDSGLNALEFAIAYDPAVLSISKVELLYDTGADAAEAAVSPDLAGTVFHCEDFGGKLWVRWATALLNSDYWLKEERALLQISGTMPQDAAPGSHSALHLIPADSSEEITAGYLDETGGINQCRTSLTDGHIWKLLDETGATMYGDLNMDGSLEIADAVLLHRTVAEEDADLNAAAYANADCESDGVLTIADFTLMLRVLDGHAEAKALGAH
ncbi:MAG: hypothetical protein J6Z45_01230 [Oscillospiraceae bacterium]|nr:hypothetical protein [Oscillospiraceae bacterium]